jgi:hypothetical protein
MERLAEPPAVAGSHEIGRNDQVPRVAQVAIRGLQPNLSRAIEGNHVCLSGNFQEPQRQEYTPRKFGTTTLCFFPKA